MKRRRERASAHVGASFLTAWDRQRAAAAYGCHWNLGTIPYYGDVKTSSCGECHLRPFERCDICGFVEPARVEGG